MKTIVYVDGFSFYYGCLRSTYLKDSVCRSVDLVSLFRDCLLPSSSGVVSQLLRMNYFTSQNGYGVLLSENPLLQVWQLEEKQADVRLGLEFLHDALSGEVEQLVLCSSDADLLPALQVVRDRRPDCRLGLVVPSMDKPRKVHPELLRLTDWCRAVVYQDELAACTTKTRGQRASVARFTAGQRSASPA